MQIKKIKSKYYIYDYILDLETGKYKSVYVGIATEQQFKKYKKRIDKEKIRNFCTKCGYRKKETLPDFIDTSKYICKCR